MAENEVLVSICIPVYNSELYIQDTLKCLSNQSYPYLEFIIVDDESTDDTVNKIKSIKDNRIKLILSKKGGAARARNIAFNNSNGDFILFFDADDLADQNYISTQINALSGQKNSVVLAQWGRFINNDLNTFKLVPNPKNSMNLHSWVDKFWTEANPMTNPGRILIPREIVNKAGLWNEELSLNDDLEFFTRIFDKSDSILFNNRSIFYYRSGINGLSSNKGLRAYTSLFNSIKLSTVIVLNRYNNKDIQRACANMWKSFIYIIYPNENHLVKLAERELKTLVKPNLKMPAGRISTLLIKLIGWKLTTIIKLKCSSR